MKTFKCGALVEMLVPSDQMDAKRRDKLKRNCESVDLLVMQSSQGGSLRVLAHEKEIFVSFSCESLDTFFIEEAWEDILCSAEEILYIPDPMTLYEISRSGMGFFISCIDGGQAKMEIMFDKVLVRK